MICFICKCLSVLHAVLIGSAELVRWSLQVCQYLVLCPHSSSESTRWGLQGCQYLVLCPHGSSELAKWGLQGCQYLVLCPHRSSESAKWGLQGCQYLVLCPHGSSELARWGLQGCQYLVLCPSSQVGGFPSDNASPGSEASIHFSTWPGIFLVGPATPVGGLFLGHLSEQWWPCSVPSLKYGRAHEMDMQVSELPRWLIEEGRFSSPEWRGRCLPVIVVLLSLLSSLY